MERMMGLVKLSESVVTDRPPLSSVIKVKYRRPAELPPHRAVCRCTKARYDDNRLHAVRRTVIDPKRMRIVSFYVNFVVNDEKLIASIFSTLLYVSCVFRVDYALVVSNSI